MFGPTLIIEDDPAIQETLAEVCLEMLGIRALTAAGAHEGLTLIANNRPSVVLLDLTLPDESGEWVADQIRSRGWAPDVRLIILSARQAVGTDAAGLGAFSFLNKPFSLNEVVNALKEAGAV